MNDLKKTIHSIDKNLNNYIIAGAAALALIFTFALPTWSAFGVNGRIGLVFDTGDAFSKFLCIVNIVLPIVILVIALLKKPVTFILPGVLFVTTLLLGLVAPTLVGMGVGLILNMLIYVALTVYCYFRKDAPRY